MSSGVFAIIQYLLITIIFLQSEGTCDQSSLDQIINSANIEIKTLSISIDKSDYKLNVHSGEKLIKTYSVVFGGNPVDDKLLQGDQCTPEGDFKVRTFYSHRSWSKFIWIDYPNDQSRHKHRKAKENGKIPSSAKIGGEIGIHGVPEGLDYAIQRKMNWTLGCISMTNKDINELYPYVFAGMDVQISK